jgi:hypothetical protein
MLAYLFAVPDGNTSVLASGPHVLRFLSLAGL